MSSATIKLQGVTKQFGQLKAVNDANLEVMPGEIFGFLGPNGAGKSTTINMLVDLIRPTSGTISIFGLDSQKDSLAIRQRIGFLNADMSLDNGLTGLQQLTYFGHLYGKFNNKLIHELATLLELNLNRKIKTLSRGNRQKVGLISALMNEPDLLIMDEPTTGLDPLIQAKFNKVILDYKKRGKTIFMSSHLLSEVQEICDRVAFVREGKIISVQSLSSITVGAPKSVTVRTDDKKFLDHLKKMNQVKVNHVAAKNISFTYSGDVNLLLNTLAKHEVLDVTIEEITLEDTFMQFYEGSDHV
jgi:ABC-2 type transport system ATP-binding protein